MELPTTKILRFFWTQELKSQIVDTTFARKVGCVIDESQRQQFVGSIENIYTNVGRTEIKISSNGSLVY